MGAQSDYSEGQGIVLWTLADRNLGKEGNKSAFPTPTRWRVALSRPCQLAEGPWAGCAHERPGLASSVWHCWCFRAQPCPSRFAIHGEHFNIQMCQVDL